MHHTRVTDIYARPTAEALRILKLEASFKLASANAQLKIGRIPQVSIGMPVYNGAKYIREALDSLLAQTFFDFELIVSDNASTDDTETICKSYERVDSRLRYVRQNENRGALANFQFVLDQAKGQFFMWAAADDLWDNHWIEAIVTKITDDKTVAGFGKLMHMDAEGSILPHPANSTRLQFEGVRLIRKLEFYLANEGMGKANLFYALYPRDILNSINLEKGLHDYQILFALLDHIAYVQVPGPAFYKRIHGENEGIATENIWRYPVILAPVRLLQRDLQITRHYLQNVSQGLQLILILLVPLKLLKIYTFRVAHRASLLRNWLRLRLRLRLR